MQFNVGLTKSTVTSYTNTSATTEQKTGATASTKETTSSASTRTQLSSLAGLLSDAATRAEKRDASNSRTQLKDMAEALLTIIDGPVYEQNKARNDQEVPNSQNPERLAQAQNATGFLNGKTSNPFAGMQRDQLSLIAYDEGNTFTVNERRSALLEINSQDERWMQKFVSDANQEISTTGNYQKSWSALLTHYRSLPAIEQAQNGENLEQQLMDKISNPTGNSKDATFTQALQAVQQQHISSMRSQISSLSLFALAASRK